ncbi:MAG: UDP-N-acetylmuramoyl-tripeptide--D-alanyl-D-alanine ligase [Balneolaceae bacterium]|nr:MAG: UDP-N-acetylmuramoyl-tripeptide--D-alanyl-D-alanine ligase [Balneolaceae bacterium]
MIAVVIRHSLYRMRYFLHMFQQNGYSLADMYRWFSGHLFSRGITAEHLFFNLLILGMTAYAASRITMTAGSVIMATVAIFWFIDVDIYSPVQQKKPLVFTSRMKRLAVIYLLPVVAAWYYLIDFSYNRMVIRDYAGAFVNTDPYFVAFFVVLIDMLIPLFLFVVAAIIQPVERFIQEGFKKQAREKLSALSHVKVIAITGSYGKTSTKFTISALLGERYQVCVTPGSFNTPMGICKVINSDLEAHHEILILEMGARYRGNIKELCEIARPDISVITNVGVSHLETFGSQEVIAHEKATLARELKPGGILILNGEDEWVKAMKLLRDDVTCIVTGPQGTVMAEGIETGGEGTSFDLVLKDEKGRVRETGQIATKLLGRHNVQNLLLAAAVANELDIRIKTVALAASKINPVEHRLELKQRNGITVIDDAFNSNPVGAANAVEVLSSFSGVRKIIITPGMIELGDAEDDLNEQFGRDIGEGGIDLAILVGGERIAPIERGIRRSDPAGKTEIRIVNSLFEANDLLAEVARPGDVVLYENDLPDSYNS